MRARRPMTSRTSRCAMHSEPIGTTTASLVAALPRETSRAMAGVDLVRDALHGRLPAVYLDGVIPAELGVRWIRTRRGLGVVGVQGVARRSDAGLPASHEAGCARPGRASSRASRASALPSSGSRTRARIRFSLRRDEAAHRFHGANVARPRITQAREWRVRFPERGCGNPRLARANARQALFGFFRRHVAGRGAPLVPPGNYSARSSHGTPSAARRQRFVACRQVAPCSIAVNLCAARFPLDRRVSFWSSRGLACGPNAIHGDPFVPSPPSNSMSRNACEPSSHRQPITSQSGILPSRGRGERSDPGRASGGLGMAQEARHGAVIAGRAVEAVEDHRATTGGKDVPWPRPSGASAARADHAVCAGVADASNTSSPDGRGPRRASPRPCR